jgi:chromosome segregation protein
VLTAKPWERRIFIEEAAGIARYKQQRAETHGKLEATRLNLQRVRDVMEEVRRQLASIERQARKARQYKALDQERQALDLALLAADFESLAAQHQTVTDEMAQIRLQEDATRTLMAGLTTRQALIAASIQDTEFRLGDLRQAVQKMQSDAERLLERREQTSAQIGDLDEEEARLTAEIRALGERQVALLSEREDKLLLLAGAREGHALGQARLEELASQLGRAAPA